MEENIYEVTVTMTNVYRIAAKDGPSASRIAAEDYIWGEDALMDVEVALVGEE